MINLKQLLLGALVLTGTTLSYAQKKTKEPHPRDISRDLYMGVDQVKDIVTQNRDTTFTRYFAGNFEVQSTDEWTNKIIYKGQTDSDKYYTYSTSNYVRNAGSEELILRKEYVSTYALKGAWRTKMASKEFLLDGLVEEISYKGKEKSVKCIDKEGKVLNEKGCLRYTIAPISEEEVLKLRIDVVDAARKASRKKGMLPKYRLTNLVADYETKTWKVYQEFPADFDKSNPMYERLKTAVENAFKDKKVDEVYYNKDINGNYYDNIFFVNGTNI